MAFQQWKEEHQALWEFILFNILSNVSTAARFIVTWIGTALTGGAGTVVVFLAELASQVVNYFVQMKFVFKSTADFSKSAPKYAVLALIIIVMNSVIVPKVGQMLISAGVAATAVNGVIVPVAGTLLAVIISFPLLKFWIAPDDK
ncbi:MAG: PTS cellobiose transporter subunit IIC [Atopobiaceae bacterium]|nr:PTS cellobiose transporter subunit IIC [Atopobiaceae bacterium]MBR1830035.1 PTS cellobiose transporter subunit IIC [Atopobiaceae bacterium]